MAYRHDDRGDIVMSDYQVTNYGMCGECRYHTLQTRTHPNKNGLILYTCQVVNEWVCANSHSEHYTYSTNFIDTCEEWEQR